jgi:Lon protease-like protein
MAVLAMFPLGAVLFPYMPLRLRVFEERYLIMLSDLVKAGDTRFGVVLIERGHEVGGGEQRFGIGTVAEMLDVTADQGFVHLTAHGGPRLEVLSWLDDAPHPRAEVRELPELIWDDDLEPLRQEADRLVRRTLAMASEFAENVWPAAIELSEDPIEASWQLAGIAPLNAIDQLTLLRSTTAGDLLTTLIKLTNEASVVYDASWLDDQGPTD